MQVISTWSLIDQQINALVADFLKLDIMAVTKMLQAVDNISTRRALVRACAEHVLAAEDFELFESTLQTIKASEKKRHAFAHHIWAAPDGSEHMNALLLINPKLINLHLSSTKEWVATNNLIGRPEKAIDTPPFLSEILYFKEKDLQEDVAAASRANSLVPKLIDLAPGGYGPTKDARRAELSSDPLIQQALDNRSKQKTQKPL
jgi:hypothetical protein